MKPYQCHKQVQATPMTRGDYNALQGWTIPQGENPADEGYLVEYLDGGKPNHPDYQNYISWSPKDVFEAGYSSVEPAETAEIMPVTDLDQFAAVVSAWHAQAVAECEHMLKVPLGTEMTFNDEAHLLNGDLHKGFLMGMNVAMMRLGILPFVMGYVDAEEPELGAANDEQPTKH